MCNLVSFRAGLVLVRLRSVHLVEQVMYITYECRIYHLLLFVSLSQIVECPFLP
jgi:hypothetical protein